MATLILERDATVTGKGQTTVPKPVRDALGIRAGDRIRYRVDGDSVSLCRAEDHDQDDPVLTSFLAFLAQDMARRPQALSALTPELVARIAGLVGGVEFDPQDEIEGPVSI